MISLDVKKKYSIASIVKNSFSNNENWGKMWRNPNPKKHYDVIIVGGGISGSYLAFKLKEEFQDILIIEKSKVLGGRLCTKPVGYGMAVT